MVLTGETEVLGEKHYTVWVVDGWMSVEQWWKMVLTGETEVLGEKPVLYPFYPPPDSNGLSFVRTEASDE